VPIIALILITRNSGGGEAMVIFDIDGKKVLKVSLQMEVDTPDKKLHRF